MGLFYKKDGEKVFLGSIEGEITNIQKQLNQPPKGQNWEAYHSYEFTFFDPACDPKFIILSLRLDAYTIGQVMNLLATVHTPHAIRIDTWKQPSGHLGLKVYNNDQQLEWKYNWDKEKGGFAEIPNVIKTKIREDAAGKPIYNYDWSKRSAFIEDLIHQAYATFTGKQWSNVQVAGDNPTNPSQHTKNKSSAMKIKEGVRTHLKTVDAFINAWTNEDSKKSLAARIKRDVPDFIEQSALVRELESHLNTLSIGTKYTLSIDGTYTAAPTERTTDTMDDLPF